LLSEKEKKTLLFDWNDTEADYPREQCVHQLFQEQAKKTPHAVAVIYDQRSVTYKELDRKSSVLAKYLQHRGIRPNALAAIYLERSLEMITGLLGILKAGGAYIPLDPGYPGKRLQYILKDSQAGIILTQSQFKENVSILLNPRGQPGSKGLKTPVAVLDEVEKGHEQYTRERGGLPPCPFPVNLLAYVIYTSGSTGNPKGVMIPHRSLTNFLISMAFRPGLQKEDKLLAVTTYSFDIAGLELYLPLIKGARCFICETRATKDAEKLKNRIRRIKPAIMQATPSTWTMLFHAGWQNEENVKILCGGEALPESLKQHFIDTGGETWNLFGPTETTIWSTIERVKEDKPITIGKPIANTGIYIL
ncbi:MAG: AMP-binding protein, partial [bacterium]|nr:AMP-binding protein [bacterium]